MSAQERMQAVPARCLVPMTTMRLDTVIAIERLAYAVPWTRGNFIDSLASRYLAQCLLGDRGVLLGYCVMMQGAGEAHLLNLTVAPAAQGCGHARYMLDALVSGCRRDGLVQLWLEVRASNARARSLYRRYGMIEVGLRKAYYPGANPGASGSSTDREDALVMSLRLDREG